MARARANNIKSIARAPKLSTNSIAGKLLDNFAAHPLPLYNVCECGSNRIVAGARAFVGTHPSPIGCVTQVCADNDDYTIDAKR